MKKTCSRSGSKRGGVNAGQPSCLPQIGGARSWFGRASFGEGILPTVLSLLAGFVLLTVGATAHATDDRTVDSVSAGDESSESAHSLQSTNSMTRTAGGRVFRAAETNGWFSWKLKVLPDAPQELYIEFGGGGVRRGAVEATEIFVDDTRLAGIRLNGTARGAYYPLTSESLKGKNAVTVRFQPSAGSRVGGVGSIAVERPPVPTLASTSTPSSPRTNYAYIVKAINDLREPKTSRDRYKAHFDWWPAKGTNQWVQYDFPKPSRVSSVEVYWFDDTGIGECRLPTSWRVLFRQNGEWKPVTNPSGYGVEPDRYNRATFDPVETDGLRLDVRLPENFSSGILQWRVE